MPDPTPSRNNCPVVPQPKGKGGRQSPTRSPSGKWQTWEPPTDGATPAHRDASSAKPANDQKSSE